MFEADSRVKTYLARVIFESGRPLDASKLLRTLIESKYQFQGNERSLLLNVWDSLILPLRQAILNLLDEGEPQGNMHLAVNELKALLLSNLNEIIGVTESIIYPSTAGDDEARAVYGKWFGDFLRYKCELLPSDQQGPLAAESKKHYERTIEIFLGMPGVRVEMLQSTYLNMAILMANFLGQKQKAIDLITGQHRELSVSLDKYPEDLKVKIQDMIDLMAVNLQIWQTSQ